MSFVSIQNLQKSYGASAVYMARCLAKASPENLYQCGHVSALSVMER